MRILVTATHLPTLEKLLAFSAQLVCRVTEAPVVLLVPETAAQPPPNLEIFQAQVRAQACYETAEAKIRFGSVSAQIIAQIREQPVELVILADITPKNRLARLRYKPFATQVVERTRCPVLIVRGEYRQIERILLCDSGSEGSSLLSRLTAQLADLLVGEEQITILHVMSQISAGPGVVGKQLRAEAQELIAEQTPEGQLLTQDLQILSKPKIHPQPKVRHGLVLDEILSEARSGNYDLVVIGAHREQGWQRYLLDNLAQKIIEQIDRPVLVVK